MRPFAVSGEKSYLFIKKTDYLKNSKNEKKVDFVIGNPPYVTYHDISVEESS